ncbi:MAG: sulfur carrier protein ThiS [Nitrospirae bacterium]|nr:sulfur carrier protein ThiS [Nitrospirota bacterium]
MDITLNGEKRSVPDEITVSGLLEFLIIHKQRVAVERNEEIVKKDAYASTSINEGDRLEVVSFMQGGCAQARLEIAN